MTANANATLRQRLIPPAGGVAVRMYRQGLGDSFLLAFATKKPRRPTYVLIDCGVHNAQPQGRDNIRLIVDDLIEATGGRVDVLVVTHEHIDHISGFLTAADQIEKYQRPTAKADEKLTKLQFRRLWLGWTENQDDPVAKHLSHARDTARRALAAASNELAEHVHEHRLGAMEAEALGERIAAGLSFFGLEPEPSDDRGASQQERSASSDRAYDFLRERVESVAYLRPGQAVLRIPQTAAARAYVLGPPEALSSLKKSDPSSGHAQETYLSSATGLVSFAAAALGAEKNREASPDKRGDIEQTELCNPFGPEHRISYETARKSAFFQRYYGLGEPYHDEAWRQIDTDWLFSAEQLALDLDSHTNNTSVALAFELGPPGQGPVLLFAADAQVGSWLSWGDLSWGKQQPITVDSLFARTAIYKVGHHASHNATLRRDAEGRDYGLALMPDGLVAMIPVDAAAAGKLRGWHMPAPNLYRALLHKTRKNVLRSDEAAGINVPPEKRTPIPGCPGMSWRRSAAVKAAGDGPLYYDVFLKTE